MRYDAHVQTIWKENPRVYHTRSNMGVEWTRVLDCFKKIYYDTEGSKNKALVHGALVNVSGKGIFLVGECRSGKSTLMMNLLERLGGNFVTGGNTLLESNGNGITGFYLPRDVYLRFSSI
jgi:ABC-type microcin C transport system duplicated ATPase subunit YejF